MIYWQGQLTESQDGERDLEVTLNTRQSPYRLDVFYPGLTELTGTDRLFVMADIQPGSHLALETSYQDLKLTMDQEITPAGRKFSVQTCREGTCLDYNLDLEYDENDHSYQFAPTSKLQLSSNDPRLKSQSLVVQSSGNLMTSPDNQ